MKRMMSRRSVSFRLVPPGVVAILLLSLPACNKPSNEGDSNVGASKAATITPAAAVDLTVQVAGDVDLAEGVRLLRGEWKARTGGELKVDSVSLEELLSDESPVGDVVIFPSRLLGTLVQRGDLRPLRPATLNNPALGLNDIYPAIRTGEMRYGGQTMAFPLGSPPLFRFQQLAGSRGAESPPAIVPTDGRAAAFVLMLRALGYTESYRRNEALFDATDMAPRIAEPQFVRALRELTAAGEPRRDMPPVGIAEGMQLVCSGEASSTLGWPGAIDEKFAAAAGAAPRDVEFTALEPQHDVYSQSRGAWEHQTNPASVVLLGVEGRLAGVSKSTRNAVAAFQLAQWLTSGDVAASLSSRSTGTLWYRASQAGSSSRWLKGLTIAKGGESVTKVVAAALTTDAPVLIPRIPAIDEYLDALAEAVRLTPADEAAAKEALAAAAGKWDAITDRLGREKQAEAYRRHLGLEELTSN